MKFIKIVFLFLKFNLLTYTTPCLGSCPHEAIITHNLFVFLYNKVKFNKLKK